jgi:hypothetical protein
MGVLLHGYPMPLALAREAIAPNSHFGRRGEPGRHASPVAVGSVGMISRGQRFVSLCLTRNPIASAVIVAAAGSVTIA